MSFRYFQYNGGATRGGIGYSLGRRRLGNISYLVEIRVQPLYYSGGDDREAVNIISLSADPDQHIATITIQPESRCIRIKYTGSWFTVAGMFGDKLQSSQTLPLDNNNELLA